MTALSLKTKTYLNMKKVLFVLVMALMSLDTQAQEPVEIDEELLIGEWGVNASYSEWRRNLLLTGLELGQFGTSTMNLYDVSRDTSAKLEYNDFYVTNGNKLHLFSVSRSSVVRFVIMEFYKNDEDGCLHMIMREFGEGEHHTFHLKKMITDSSVSSIPYKSQGTESKFNLQGIQVEGNKGVFIQNGRKYIDRN